MKASPSQILFSALGLAAITAQATPAGVNMDPAGPLWDRSTPGTAFTSWESFPEVTYTDDAPDASYGTTGVGGAGNPVLSQTATWTNFEQGAGLYTTSSGVPTPTGEAGDVIFAGGNPVNFVAEGEVSFTIRGIYLQIKRPSTSTTASGTALADQLFPTLKINNGASFIPDGFFVVIGSNDTASDSGNYGTTTWFWGDSISTLSQNALNDFQITMARSPFQRNIDSITVDLGSVRAIPEPASIAFLASGLGLLARRPRQLAA